MIVGEQDDFPSVASPSGMDTYSLSSLAAFLLVLIFAEISSQTCMGLRLSGSAK